MGRLIAAEFRWHVLTYRSAWGEMPLRDLLRRFYHWAVSDVIRQQS
jgi:hypothetical protein